MLNRLSLAAALLIAGNACAADALHIQSEDQFAREYASQTVRVAPGIYQMTAGQFAGKTVTIGENGLAYDIAALRAKVPATVRERAVLKARIKHLEALRARYAKARTAPTLGQSMKSASGAFVCSYYNPRTGAEIGYVGSATVTATTEYYMSNGSGGLNPYYARAYANASGTVSKPASVPAGSGVLSATAVAWNHQNNVLVQRFGYGASFSIGTGMVYSGPNFSHNLEAFSNVEGEGDCVGYVGISDALQ